MTHIFYQQLAAWWPLISPVEEYAEEATVYADLLGLESHESLLELGSGGGHNAFYLKRRVKHAVLVDLSDAMLAVSRELNPTCEHHVGDMRTWRGETGFDAVFVHDAIDYMTNEEDLKALLANIAWHLRPGGRFLLAPDHMQHAFEPSTEHGGTNAPDGRGVRYLEWSFLPGDQDSTVHTHYTLVTRDADGRCQAFSETQSRDSSPWTLGCASAVRLDLRWRRRRTR